jgi:hypothetical protein
MAYVPGVKNDLFISYAHVDNEEDSHKVRWVSEFVRGFLVELRQRLGGPRDFALFFDESSLEAHHHLEFLLENARQSAIFVAVLSPSYVAHDWTIRELREFAAIVSDSRRIIVIEKLPLESYDAYPSEIDDLKRTQFWRTNEPESRTPSTLTVHGRPTEYRARLETLADQVQRLMREMRKASEQPQVVRPPRPPIVDPIPPASAPKIEASVTTATAAAEPTPDAASVAIKAPPKSGVTSSLIGTVWPETADNRSSRQGILVGATAVAVLLGYLLGDMLDVTASKTFEAISVPAAIYLIVAAAYDFRLTMLIAPLATALLAVVHLAALYAHFNASSNIAYALGLVAGQLAAAVILQRAFGDAEKPPPLWLIGVAMIAAGAAYEIFETAGAVLRNAIGTSEGIDWVLGNPNRWYSVCYAIAAAIVVFWLGWRLALRRTP